MKTEESIKQMFDNLKNWIPLPKYQAERRLDLFFGLYLKDILKNTMPKLFANDELHIIPEFPLQIDKVNKEEANKDGNNKKGRMNDSNNIDYLVFNETQKRIYAIELKTDCNSINDRTQIKYYKRLKNEITAKELIEFAKKARKGKYKKKYEYLADKVKEEYKDYEIGDVIYIVPRDCSAVDKIKVEGFKYITFENIVKCLKDSQHDDFLLAQFLGFLETQNKCK